MPPPVPIWKVYQKNNSCCQFITTVDRTDIYLHGGGCVDNPQLVAVYSNEPGDYENWSMPHCYSLILQARAFLNQKRDL